MSNTFAGQISRELARQYGLEAVRIIQDGFYQTPTGQHVVIQEAVARSVEKMMAYPPDKPFEPQMAGPDPAQIDVRNETTLSAAQRLLIDGFKPVVLNFASATHPGGGFLSGARAQEEYLARSSGLYACLKDQPMYPYHLQHSDPLATSYMLYSPDVPVFRGDDGRLLEQPYQVGIITAAAPNASHMVGRAAEIELAFRERIAKVLWIGQQHAHDAIVLGAWGCGAFGNDGKMVSRLFQQALNGDYRGAYRRVIFAIVDWSDDRKFIGPFEETFGIK